MDPTRGPAAASRAMRPIWGLDRQRPAGRCGPPGNRQRSADRWSPPEGQSGGSYPGTGSGQPGDSAHPGTGSGQSGGVAHPGTGSGQSGGVAHPGTGSGQPGGGACLFATGHTKPTRSWMSQTPKATKPTRIRRAGRSMCAQHAEHPVLQPDHHTKQNYR